MNTLSTVQKESGMSKESGILGIGQIRSADYVDTVDQVILLNLDVEF